MAAQKTHKGQHWIPRSYLRAWVDPTCPPDHTPYIHIIAKDGASQRRRAPENVFKETDLYTIASPDGSRDLRLEKGLSGLEESFARTLGEYINLRKPLPAERLATVSIFVSAMYARTPFLRDHWKSFWDGLVEKGEQISAHLKANPKQGLPHYMLSERSGNGMSLEQIRAMAASPMESLLQPTIQTVAPLLARMEAQFLCTDDSIGFITSDTPAVWYDPEAYKRPPAFRQPALAYETTEITMPLSPQTCLRLVKGTPAHYYIDLSKQWVDELNRRTRYFCHRHFVSRTDQVNEYWLWHGHVQTDPWAKRAGAD